MVDQTSLEKLARYGLGRIGLRNIKNAWNKGGFSGAVDEAKKYKVPMHNMLKEEYGKTTKVHHLQRRDATMSRGVLSSIGNSADTVSRLTKGVGGKGVWEGTKQLTKNTGDVLNRHMRSSLYKEDVGGEVITKGGKKFVKSKFPLFSDREVISTTERGSNVIRKRKALTPLTLSATGPGIGAIGYGLAPKDTSRKKNLAHSVGEAAAFTVSTPVGIASTFLR